jgi:hypothetical protein
MPHPEHIRLLEKCPTPDSGCFATDPESLDALVDFHDSVVTANLESALGYAVKAGANGVPLENATYHTMILKEEGSSLRIKTGAEKLIMGEGTSDVDKARRRIAACAHACGATALKCPILATSES